MHGLIMWWRLRSRFMRINRYFQEFTPRIHGVGSLVEQSSKESIESLHLRASWLIKGIMLDDITFF